MNNAGPEVWAYSLKVRLDSNVAHPRLRARRVDSGAPSPFSMVLDLERRGGAPVFSISV